MAAFSIHISILCFYLLTLTPTSVSPNPHQTLTNNPNSNNFDPEIELLGDAEIVNGGPRVQMVQPFASSSGILFYKKPFNFIHGIMDQATSFSTRFSFSLPRGNGNCLALIFLPYKYNCSSNSLVRGSFEVLGENKHLAIEFHTRIVDNTLDLNADNVDHDVGSLVSVSISNASSINSVVDYMDKLESWIDYRFGSLEVRLSKFGEAKPIHPILIHKVNLLEMLGSNGDVLVGLVSKSSNSSHTTSVYSWKTKLRKLHKWMHSLPVDPKGVGDKSLRVHKRSSCPSKILAGLIFATVCGGLLAFMVLFACAIFVDRQTVFPMKNHALPVEFRYEKINVVVKNEPEEFLRTKT